VPVLEPCVQILGDLGIQSELHVMSAHRSPERLRDFVFQAESNGFEVIVAAAGLAAHLPGVVASLTTLPVIGVPIASGDHGVAGLDALLSIVQMPPGVPVACVAINGAKNAGLLAATILALKHDAVKQALRKFRQEQSSA
jgi:5-(carboxyamino)imidazole ribonucleotide mutase